MNKRSSDQREVFRQPDPLINLYATLQGGRCIATFGVSMTTWRIQHVVLRVSGEFETWTFDSWELWNEG